jgi:hypothetical protein
VTKGTQATERYALLSPKASTKCCYSNTRVIRHSFWGPQRVPTMGPVICFSYLTRLVSNSWHTSDGVIPTKMEGHSHTTLNHFMVMNFCYTQLWYRKRQRQHMTSFVDHVHKRAKIVLDFWTKIKVMMKIILPVMNIIKPAKICKSGLNQHPGHSLPSTELPTQVQCSSWT